MPSLSRSNRIGSYLLRCFSPPVQSKHRHFFSSPCARYDAVPLRLPLVPVQSSQLLASALRIRSLPCICFSDAKQYPASPVKSLSSPNIASHRVALALQLVSFRFRFASTPIKHLTAMPLLFRSICSLPCKSFSPQSLSSQFFCTSILNRSVQSSSFAICQNCAIVQSREACHIAAIL